MAVAEKIHFADIAAEETECAYIATQEIITRILLLSWLRNNILLLLLLIEDCLLL